MADEVIDFDFRRHAQDLRECWQGRLLAEAHGDLSLVVQSILAHNFDEAFATLMHVVFPGFEGLYLPGFTSAAKVDKAGRVVADYANRDGRITKDFLIFKSEMQMRNVLRRLADKLKFTDQERLEFFTAARRWVVADRRLDPTMNPMDPDAKRLTVN